MARKLLAVLLTVPSSLQSCPRREGTEPRVWFIPNSFPSPSSMHLEGCWARRSHTRGCKVPVLCSSGRIQLPALVLIRDEGRGSAETPAPWPSPRACLRQTCLQRLRPAETRQTCPQGCTGRKPSCLCSLAMVVGVLTRGAGWSWCTSARVHGSAERLAACPALLSVFAGA